LEYYLFLRQDTKSPQQPSRGANYENARYQNNTNEHGNNDNNYAGGHNRGEVSQQQSSTQVYRPPHIQNRMNNTQK
jgi:hypothetical protein